MPVNTDSKGRVVVLDYCDQSNLDLANPVIQIAFVST